MRVYPTESTMHRFRGCQNSAALVERMKSVVQPAAEIFARRTGRLNVDPLN